MKSLSVRIKYTKDFVEVDGDKMGIDEWVYSTLDSNGDYDGVGIEYIEVQKGQYPSWKEDNKDRYTDDQEA